MCISKFIYIYSYICNTNASKKDNFDDELRLCNYVWSDIYITVCTVYVRVLMYAIWCMNLQDSMSVN